MFKNVVECIAFLLIYILLSKFMFIAYLGLSCGTRRTHCQYQPIPSCHCCLDNCFNKLINCFNVYKLKTDNNKLIV